ncbi:DUF1295 domain-containing protein, partial [bacterium]|nr:DUF1295 domain-containing protein [bacterium]
MHDLTTLLLAGTTTVLGMMFLLWCLHLALKNAAVVDVGWTAGLGMLAVLYAWLGTGWGPRRALLGTLVVVWSLRLGTHLAVRVARHHPEEDRRYAQLRRDWAAVFHRKMFGFFQLQAV